MPSNYFTLGAALLPRTSMLKHLKFVMIAFAIFLGLASIAAAQTKYDEGVVAVTVSAPANQGVGQGVNFVVPITTTDTTGLGIISYDTKVTYNPAVVQLQSPSTSVTGTISDGGTMTVNPIAPGELIISYFRAAFLAGSGTLFHLRFTAIGTPGQTSNISFVPAPVTGPLAFMYNEGVPAAIPVNGMVTITAPTSAPSSVSGQVFDTNGQAVIYARVSFTGQDGTTRTTMSNSFGYYALEGLPSGDAYLISVRAKGLSFTPRTLFVGNDVTGFDLTADK